MNIDTTVAPEADYAAVTAPGSVRIQRLLPGPIERIWGYLTEGDLLRQRLAAHDMAPQAGSTFELVWRNDELTDPPGNKPEGFGGEHRMQSRILEFDPPRRLAFTWNDSGRVAFDLESMGDKVMLTIDHEGISDRGNMLMIGAGWHMHVNVLEARVGGRESEPFWDGWLRLRGEYDRRIPA
mgnify:CR=1 FL=1